MKVNKTFKRVLKISLGLIALIPTILLGQILLFNMKYKNDEKIIFGWDKENRRFQINEKKQYELNGIDGPYLIGDTLYYVNEENIVVKSTEIKDSLQVRVPNKDADSFHFSLRKNIEKDLFSYAMPEKLIAISDIEGNFDAFCGFLQKNKIIDQNFNWVFGKGHLVLNGDFVDRGQHVTPTLWLIYKLEEQALQQGGKIHYVLGNHEIMNFQGNHKYADAKYIKLAQIIYPSASTKESYKILYSEKSEIGRWLRTKNVVTKIGDYLFVHAGFSPEILSHHLSLENINEITRKNWDKDLYKYPQSDSIANFLLGRRGPFWYRGLVKSYKYYDKANAEDVQKILKTYQAEKIVVGHSIVDAVSADYHGKVIRIDVKHGNEKHSPQTQGLLVENGIEYKTDAMGKRTKL
ncbi:metallophosphoesterase [Capnocytophaga canimorsus]|uniref:metallophosphoesterase n=1 Tax=Capnocytophaga canimorsus TaxID=28188 RepID=UPI0037D24D68